MVIARRPELHFSSGSRRQTSHEIDDSLAVVAVNDPAAHAIHAAV
jgi:hypothetical protein